MTICLPFGIEITGSARVSLFVLSTYRKRQKERCRAKWDVLSCTIIWSVAAWKSSMDRPVWCRWEFLVFIDSLGREYWFFNVQEVTPSWGYCKGFFSLLYCWNARKTRTSKYTWLWATLHQLLPWASPASRPYGTITYSYKMWILYSIIVLARSCLNWPACKRGIVPTCTHHHPCHLV